MEFSASFEFTPALIVLWLSAIWLIWFGIVAQAGCKLAVFVGKVVPVALGFGLLMIVLGKF